MEAIKEAGRGLPNAMRFMSYKISSCVATAAAFGRAFSVKNQSRIQSSDKIMPKARFFPGQTADKSNMHNALAGQAEDAEA